MVVSGGLGQVDGGICMGGNGNWEIDGVKTKKEKELGWLNLNVGAECVFVFDHAERRFVGRLWRGCELGEKCVFWHFKNEGA